MALRNAILCHDVVPYFNEDHWSLGGYFETWIRVQSRHGALVSWDPSCLLTAEMKRALPAKGSAKDPIDLDAACSSVEKSLKRQHQHETSSSPVPSGPITPSVKRHRPEPQATAPIKLFRTTQMEEASKFGDDALIRANTTTLRELLIDGVHTIQWIIISNFLVDFALLLDEVPELVSVNRILCFYGSCAQEGPLEQWKELCREKDGSTHFHAVCLNPSDSPRSATNPLERRIPYGVHHSKFFLVGYSNKTLRVVIHTANLVYGDLHLKADAAFKQDFPLKGRDTTTSSFEQDLMSYLQSYRYDVRHTWDESTNPALSMIQMIAKYDFSSAQAVLIPSVPGYHLGNDIHKFGHMKLRRTVRKASQIQPGKAALVCQFSSMGSLNETWLQNEFKASATSMAAGAPIHVVFPTAEEVRCSVEGYAGGASLPADSKNVEKDFIRPLYRRWSSNHDPQNPFSMARNLPHIKTFFRYDKTGNGMEWFVLTSHNISSAAWGQLQKKGQQFFVRHWELGVFLSPETLSCDRLVPLTRDGCANGTKAVPLPYKLYPETYEDGDIPWAWDKEYPECDSFGRFGLR